ncbi:MAG: class I SAM-dependent methyltransferase [Phycisphaerales bacterium]|jgi:SAM-dependent methyltransferase|nr:class I SAM-dependent methyltransferase [Phycisphaerales bacterium]
MPEAREAIASEPRGVRRLIGRAARKAAVVLLGEGALTKPGASTESRALTTGVARDAATQDASVWRGGIAGAARFPDGSIDEPTTRRWRGELAYWRDHAGPGAKDAEAFEAQFARWQQLRLEEFGRAMGFPAGRVLETWCAGADCVEIGCGPFPMVAYHAFRTGVAVDPLMEGYKAERIVPRTARPFVSIAAVGEWLPLVAASADLVVLDNCLDHTEQPERVLAEVNRVLRPHGALWMLVDVLDEADALHPSPMTRDRLGAMLGALGLRVTFERVAPRASHPRAREALRLLVRKGAWLDGEAERRARGVSDVGASSDVPFVEGKPRGRSPDAASRPGA